jgi:tetratricopeptide (TPR) repeat protein
MLGFKSNMLRKIFHVIAFLIIAALVISAVANNDPDDASKQAAQLPVLLLAGLYVGFMFVMYILPALTDKATNAVLASNETIAREPIHKAQAAYARGEYIEAITLYRAIAMEEPDNRLPWVEIAKIQHDQLEDPEISMNTLRTALEEHAWPADDTAFFMGRIADIQLNSMNDKEACIAILEQIVETFPESQYSASATHRLNEIEKAQGQEVEV